MFQWTLEICSNTCWNPILSHMIFFICPAVPLSPPHSSLASIPAPPVSFSLWLDLMKYGSLALLPGRKKTPSLKSRQESLEIQPIKAFLNLWTLGVKSLNTISVFIMTHINSWSSQSVSLVLFNSEWGSRVSCEDSFASITTPAAWPERKKWSNIHRRVF